jgi:YD repeat-containing protein
MPYAPPPPEIYDRKEKPDCKVETAAGKIWIFIPETKEPQTLRPEIAQEPPRNDTRVAAGVCIHNRTFMHSHIDHRVNSLGFDFAFQRNYRSGIDYNGILGPGWDHSYNIRVVPKPPKGAYATIPGFGWKEEFGKDLQSGDLTYYHGTGRITKHQFAGWDVLTAQWHDAQFTAIVSTYQQNNGEDFEIQRFAVLAGFPPEAVIDEAVFYRIRLRGGTRILLNCHGYVVEIRDRNHNFMRFAYGGPLNPSTNYNCLSQITDTVTRRYSLTYYVPDPVPRIKEISEQQFGGSPCRRWRYEYDSSKQLQYVHLVPGAAGAPTLRYRYEGGLLTEIVNPVEFAQQGVPQTYSWLKNTYAGVCQISKQRVGSDAGQVPAAGGQYVIEQTSDAAVTVVDRVQTARTFILGSLGDSSVVKEIRIIDKIYDGATGSVDKELVTKYEYDSQFHVTQITHPSGLNENFEFKHGNQPVTLGEEFDSLNPLYTHMNDLSRDDLTRSWIEPSKPVQPATLETRYGYEHLFNCVTEINAPLGNTTYKYQFTTASAPQYNGNPRTITGPQQINPDEVLDVIEQFDYAPGGVVREHVDPDGVRHEFLLSGGFQTGLVQSHLIGGVLEEHFSYDDFRRQTQHGDGRNATWITAYDTRDNVQSVTDPLYTGRDAYHITNFTYDLNDRLIGSVVAIGDDSYPVPAGNNPNTVIAANSVSVSGTFSEETAYDVLGRRISRKQSGTRNAFSGPTGTISNLTRSWEWYYDPEGRLLLARSPSGVSGERPDAQIRYGYNNRGLMISEIDAFDPSAPATADKNRGTRWEYDEDGRSMRETDPMLRVIKREYDGYGRPTSEQLGKDLKISSQYDDTRPVLRYRWSEGNARLCPVVLKGTDQQILASASTNGGILLDGAEFTIDPSGRVTQLSRKEFAIDDYKTVADPINDVLQRAADFSTKTWYTAAGRTKKVSDPAGRETAYAYNDQGRLWTTLLPGGHFIVYEYSGPLISSLKSTFLPPSDATPIPGLTNRTPVIVEESIDYDLLRRKIKVESQGTITRYTHDTLGNVRSKQHALGRTEYVYDGLSRPQRERVFNVDPSNPSATLDLQYDYDLNDNRTKLVGDRGITTAQYDGRGLLVHMEPANQPPVEIVRQADGQMDNLTRGGKTVQYSYTDSGRVMKIQYQDGPVQLLQLFGYDGLGNLRWCLDNNRDPQIDAILVRRHYDSLQRLTDEQVMGEAGSHYFSKIDYAYHTGQFSESKSADWGSLAVTCETGADGNLSRITSRASTQTQDVTWLERRSQGAGRIVEDRYCVQAGADQIELLLANEYRGHGLLYRRSAYIVNRYFSSFSTSGNVTNPSSQLLPLATSEYFKYGAHGMIEEHHAPVLLPSAAFYEAPPAPSLSQAGVPGSYEQFEFINSASTYYLGRPLVDPTQSPPPEILSNYKYDGAGRLYQCVDKIATDTQTITRSWDTGNRLVSNVVQRGQEREVGTFAFGWAGSNLHERTDSFSKNTVPAGQGVWKFDNYGRLSDYQDSIGGPDQQQKTYTYDPADRLVTVTVNSPSLKEPLFEKYVYDAIGRLIGKFSPHTNEYAHYEYDGDRCIREVADEVIDYVYDDGGRIVGFRSAGQEYVPISTYDGGAWLVFNRVGTQPPAQPANPTPLEQLNYYLYSAQLLVESHGTGPFDNPLCPSLGVQYYTGKPVAKPLTNSKLAAKSGDYMTELLPVRTGGQRQLLAGLYNHGEFHDPLLGAYLVPDLQGAWANPLSLGNSTCYAANNPVLLNRMLQGQSTLDASAVGGAALSAGVGVLVGIGAMAILGPVAVPIMLVGVAYSLWQGYSRVYDQVASGAIDRPGTESDPQSNWSVGLWGFTASITEAFGIRGVFEGITGRDMLTAQELDTQTRSEEFGEGIVNAASFFLPDFGGGFGAKGRSLKSLQAHLREVSRHLRRKGATVSWELPRLAVTSELGFPVPERVGMLPREGKYSLGPEGHIYPVKGVVGVHIDVVLKDPTGDPRSLLQRAARKQGLKTKRGSGITPHEAASMSNFPRGFVRNEKVLWQYHELFYGELHARDPITGGVIGGSEQASRLREANAHWSAYWPNYEAY